jgi:hypothetical protein
VAVKLHVEVPDVLVVGLLENLEEVAHIAASFDDLLVQVPLSDPADELVHAVHRIKVRDIKFLSIPPCLAAKTIVENQRLFLWRQPGYSPPCFYFSKVTTGFAPFTVILPIELWYNYFVVTPSPGFIVRTSTLVTRPGIRTTLPWVDPTRSRRAVLGSRLTTNPTTCMRPTRVVFVWFLKVSTMGGSCTISPPPPTLVPSPPVLIRPSRPRRCLVPDSVALGVTSDSPD